MRPSKWIADFLRSHPPALPDTEKNVDWQHRIRALEAEIKSKDEKIVEQRTELGEQDKKLSEARTAAADLLRCFATVQENERKLAREHWRLVAERGLFQVEDPSVDARCREA